MSSIRSALVAGGAGSIGEEIVKTLLEAGVRVFVPIRPQDKTERLKSYVEGQNADNLTLLPGDLSESRSVAKLRQAILEKVPSLDLIVVSVGSKYFGYSLHKIPRDSWDLFLSENLITHFNLIQQFLDQLYVQQSGVYITLTGPESETVIPDAGLMSVVSAAQKMMTRVAAQEASGTGVRVYSITSHTQVATRSWGDKSSNDMITAQDLGRYILALSEKRIPGADKAQHDLDNRAHVEKLMRQFH